jgi:hypothetical protein
MRWPFLCAVVFLVAGCGSTVVGRPAEGTTTVAPPDVLLAAPPIRAVDRPADLADWWSDDFDVESSDYMCFSSGGTTTTDQSPDCKPSGDEIAKFRAEEQRWRDAIRPADGTEPRTFAELPLDDGGRVEVSAWANAKGEMCLDTEEWAGDDSGGGGGPFGPCDPNEACNTLCVDPEQDNSATRLVAIVPLEGDLITITLANGERRGYPLTGPHVPGFARRAFLVDLGDVIYRAIDVTAGGVLVAHQEQSPKLVAYELCFRSVGEPPTDATDADLDAYNDRIGACFATRTEAPPGG